MIEREWHGCYDKNWSAYGLPDEAIAHPAKMAPKLTERIITHGIDQGWWKPGDLIGDPFGGIGTTGLVASWFGLRAFLMELETRFVRCALGHDCPGLTPDEWEKYKGRWHKHPDLCPRCGRKDAFEWRRNPPLFGDGDGHDYRPYRDSRPWKDPHRYEGVFERLLVPPTGPLPVMVQGDSRFEFAERAGQVAGVLCSPPYPGVVVGAHEQKETAKESRDKRRTEGGSVGQSLRSGGYGTTEGNIGNTTGDTYWEAVRLVYQQVWQALKRGGYIVVVVKDYVSKGQRVPLCEQTFELLKAVGFEPVEWIRAWQVEEQREVPMWAGTAEEDEIVERKEHIGFFRREANKKGPAIEHEVVIVMRSV